MPGGSAGNGTGQWSPRHQLSIALVSAIGPVPSEQQPQVVGELIMLSDIQGGENSVLSGQQFGQGRIDCFLTSVGQLNQHAAPVVRMILSGNQAAAGEPVHPIGHRSGRDQGLTHQLTWRQPVRRP